MKFFRLKKLNCQKGITLIEVAVVAGLGMIIILAAVGGIDMIQKQFQRIAKRSLAMSLVNNFNQTIQDQRGKFPQVNIGSTPSTLIFCYDQNLKPSKNTNGDLNSIMAKLNASQLISQTINCPATTNYEVHLTQTASSNPKALRILVIGVISKLGLIYDEEIAIPEN